MARFMLVLHEYEGGYQKMTPEESQALVQHYWRWTSQLKEADHFMSGESLEYSRVMVKQTDGQTVVDGPYTETKEIISGFYVVQADDYAAAAAIAKGCPVLTYGGAVEVREITEWE